MRLNKEEKKLAFLLSTSPYIDVLDASYDKAARDLAANGVVPVVRCKDCKYWQDNNGGYPHDECRWGKGETPDPDDFCSYGERREE